MTSQGNGLLGPHLLKEIINELMGILRLIYLQKSLTSYANGLLGFPEGIYIKKSWISYANELLGIPRLFYLKKMLSVCGRREAHLAHLLQELVISYASELLGIPRPN
jgi:hypothetical protein